MEVEPKNGIAQRLTKDASRFLIVGCIAYVTDFAIVFQLLTRLLKLHPLLAHPISRLCGGLVSFTLNKFWTFRRPEPTTPFRVQFLRYWMVWVGTLALSELLLVVGLYVVQLERHSAKLLSDGLTGFISFFVQRHWTFR